MTSKKLRQAFQAALDMEPIMAAAAGHLLFYRLDPTQQRPHRAGGLTPVGFPEDLPLVVQG